MGRAGYMMQTALHEVKDVYRKTSCTNVMYKVKYQANEARLEKADCLVRQSDEQAFGFFGRGYCTEKDTVAEIWSC